MRMRAWTLGGALVLGLATTTTGQADDLVLYFATYVQGGTQISLEAQTQPIPVPQVGSSIQVWDQSTPDKQIYGWVSDVHHAVQRNVSTPNVRAYIINVEVSSTKPGAVSLRRR